MYGLNGAVGLHASSCQRSLEICNLRAQAGAAWPKVAGQHGSAGRTPLQCWGGRSCVPLRFLRGAAGWRSALGTAPAAPSSARCVPGCAIRARVPSTSYKVPAVSGMERGLSVPQFTAAPIGPDSASLARSVPRSLHWESWSSLQHRPSDSQIAALNYLASGVPSRISSEARLTTSWPGAI